MARYIDADAFLQTLAFYDRAFDENRDFSARNTILQIMHELEHTPTADVEEVVRCKDCKYRKEDKGFVTGHYCYLRPVNGGRYCRDDDFCSYGERKNDFKE